VKVYKDMYRNNSELLTEARVHAQGTELPTYLLRYWQRLSLPPPYPHVTKPCMHCFVEYMASR